MIELLHTDCMTYMATLPDAAFDLAIVDPPYGLCLGGGLVGFSTPSLRFRSERHAMRVSRFLGFNLATPYPLARSCGLAFLLEAKSMQNLPYPLRFAALRRVGHRRNHRRKRWKNKW